jgi:hypothetical protein
MSHNNTKICEEVLMQKKLFFMGMAALLCALGLAVVIGCVGPEGAVGEKGDTGAAGANGADGISIIWKGNLAAHPANPGINWAYYNTVSQTVQVRGICLAEYN